MTKQKELSLKEIEKLRDSARVVGGIGIACLILRYGVAAYTYFLVRDAGEWTKLFGFFGSMGMGVFTYIGGFLLLRSWAKFKSARAHFYLRRYIPFLTQFRKDGYQAPWTISRWKFFRAPSLEKFEQTLIDGLRAARIAIDQQRQQEKWDRLNVRLEPQFAALLAEFQVHPLREKELWQSFSSYGNPRKRKDFLAGVASRLAYEQWKKSCQFPVLTRERQFPPPQPSKEDVEVRSMRARAAVVKGQKALELYELGLAATTRREQIRLFGAALQRDELESEAAEKVIESKAQVAKPQAEVRNISLQELVRERLDELELIIGSDADWKMCREIVLVLLEPGRRGARFNKRYFAEDTVKVTVERQYRLNVREVFDPAAFKSAVTMLLAYGVLVTKPKTDERTLSLSTRSSTAKGGQIVNLALRLKRELTGLN